MLKPEHQTFLRVQTSAGQRCKICSLHWKTKAILPVIVYQQPQCNTPLLPPYLLQTSLWSQNPLAWYHREFLPRSHSPVFVSIAKSFDGRWTQPRWLRTVFLCVWNRLGMRFVWGHRKTAVVRRLRLQAPTAGSDCRAACIAWCAWVVPDHIRHWAAVTACLLLIRKRDPLLKSYIFPRSGFSFPWPYCLLVGDEKLCRWRWFAAREEQRKRLVLISVISIIVFVAGLADRSVGDIMLPGDGLLRSVRPEEKQHGCLCLAAADSGAGLRSHCPATWASVAT